MGAPRRTRFGPADPYDAAAPAAYRVACGKVHLELEGDRDLDFHRLEQAAKLQQGFALRRYDGQGIEFEVFCARCTQKLNLILP